MTLPAAEPRLDSKPQLPPGWRRVWLGEVCEIIAGQSPPGETYRKTPEGLPFFQGKADFGSRHPVARVWCVVPTKIALPGDILISVRAPVGPTNVANVKCCIGRGLAAIRPGDQVDRDFVLAALKLLEGKLAELGSGSTFEAIKIDDLESLEIPVPPLDEQKRIAAILNEQMAALERARAAAEAQLEAAKALPAAYLRAIFTSPDAQRWPKKPLGEVCEIIAGQSPPGGTYRKTPEGVPFFQGKADFGSRYPVARVWCVAPTKIALPGDILISVRAPVGPTNVADVKCCIGRGLAAIRPGEQADRDFVLAALKLLEGKIAELGSGSTFEAIRIEDLESLEIPLPPLDEQKRIAAILNDQMAVAEKTRKALEEQLAAINALPAAFLRRTFRGEL